MEIDGVYTCFIFAMLMVMYLLLFVQDKLLSKMAEWKFGIDFDEENEEEDDLALPVCILDFCCHC